MKSAVLLPFCPWPSNTGGKVEMLKHLKVLRELGECVILSAGGKPVGTGWSPEKRREAEKQGYNVVLREDECRLSFRQVAGIGYAAVCKGLGMETAFGHSNPYHRYAFPEEWWRKHTEGADLAVIHYGYWAWLPCSCPKVIVLLDLWSDVMRFWNRHETDDLKTADLVVAISKDEEEKLKKRGIHTTLWSPPAVAAVQLPDSASVGLVGAATAFNREGLDWLAGAMGHPDLGIQVFGRLASYATNKRFIPVGPYDDQYEPYRQCGIILMTTVQGMGVQIKGIEALAAGRAIVARKGAMRGLPEEKGAWIEVDSPGEMIETAKRLQENASERGQLAIAAKRYYNKHLAHDQVLSNLRNAYLKAAAAGKKESGPVVSP